MSSADTQSNKPASYSPQHIPQYQREVITPRVHVQSPVKNDQQLKILNILNI